MRPRLLPVTLCALAAAALPLRAEPYDARQWRFLQEVPVDQPGLVRVELPVETLDAARGDLADLRVLDPAGVEQAFALEHTDRPAFRTLKPESLSGSIEDAGTVFILKTGTADEITALTIDAGQQRFLTRALVEASDDGQVWRVLGRNRPVYNRGGDVSRFAVDIPQGAYAYLRLTLDRLGGTHIALRGVSLLARRPETEAPAPVAVRITGRDDSPGETRLTLALPGANLQLAGMDISTPEPVFTRPVRLAFRAFSRESIQEVTLLRASIGRREPGERAVTLAIERAVPRRELILIIENGDSPPLAVTAIAARRRPVSVVFYATASGRYSLACGNANAAAPRYDMGTLTEESPQPPAARLTPGPLQANPAFQPGEALPEIPALGTTLEIGPWAYRKAVHVAAAGVQQLELDPAVLARAQPDFADLRLMSGDRQVPYVVERTSLSRKLAAGINSAPDPRQPHLSRWRITLPYPGLPVRSLTATIPTPLFQRDVRLIEEVEDERGAASRSWLGQSNWSHAPGQPAGVFAIASRVTPRSDMLWIETDDGDNPPIELSGVKIHYGVTRLLFKAAAGAPVFLYYGDREAAAPRYDLSLVGAQLLAADKAGAELGAEERLKGRTVADSIALAGRSGVLFWGMLILVVIVLLAVIARLLPKAPPPAGPAAYN